MNIKELIERLDRAGIGHSEIDIGSGAQILVSERGGRIFGPFFSENDTGLFWTSKVLESDDSLRAFMESGDWNMGGDRIWVAPEMQFSVGDRSRFWETLKTPSQIDPGSYKLSADGGGAELRQNLTLEAHNIGSGSIELEIRRKLMPAKNPLRCLHECEALMEDVSFCGFEHLLELRCKKGAKASAELWDLLQVVPCGHIYIPMYFPVKGVDYYEPAGELEKATPLGAILRATGANRYKLGYKAAAVTGRIAYACVHNGSYTLLVRSFPNDPSNSYAEEPPQTPGENGLSVHVYNDDGNSGGFTELECNLQSVGEGTGHEHALDRVSTWIFSSDKKEKTDAIAKALTGFEQIEY